MKTKIVEKVKTAESTISMFFGIAVVVIAGVLLFNYFKNYVKKQSPEESQPAESIETLFNDSVEEGEPAYSGKFPTKYQVQKGDSLWSISIRFFGYGYNWVDISKENNISSPNNIDIGQELTIPNVEIKKPLFTEKNVPQISNTIEGENYTVEKGDNLWNISVRAYQDGYKWVEIAKANSILNPDIIHTGNNLKIPR